MEQFESKPMAELLGHVNVRGLVEECLLSVVGGLATVQAIDLTSSLFLSCSAKIGGSGDSLSIGLTKLSMLSKFLADAGDTPFLFKIRDNWLSVKQKRRGSLKIRLLDAESVPTIVESPVTLGQIGQDAIVQLNVLPESVERLSYFVGLVGAPSVVFSVDLKGHVAVSSNDIAEQQFSFVFGKGVFARKCDKVFSSEVLADHLLKVFATVGPIEKSGDVRMLIGADCPVIVAMNTGDFWASTPITL